MSKYILAIDQGTTSTTSILFDNSFNIIGKSTVEVPQHYPKPSWVEHDLNEIWDSVCRSVNLTLKESAIPFKDVAAIGITNQRETTCLWDKDSKKPVLKAIVWQDRRTAQYCDKLKKLEKLISKKTGLLIDPYFSATKLHWIFNNNPSLLSAAKKGKIAFGTIDSFLLFKITGVHATDVSNASRTLLMDISKLKWDEDLLKIFKIPPATLPQIMPSCVEYGRTKNFLDFPDGIPVTGLTGDQQAALFGQMCFKIGMAKCTYGTGAFILINTGEKAVFSKNKLLTTVAWSINGKTTYALEGSAFIAGASVQWLRDGLNIISTSSQIESLAREVKDSDGVTFVAALSGLGAPYWLPKASGLLTGITRRTTKGHIARATLDGIAFQVWELIESMKKDMKKPLKLLKVDGGASQNDLLMQIQSDILNVKVLRPPIIETTALGSGIQAGLTIRFWYDIKEVETKLAVLLNKTTKKWSFSPKIRNTERTKEIKRWLKAINAVKILSA